MHIERETPAQAGNFSFIPTQLKNRSPIKMNTNDRSAFSKWLRDRHPSPVDDRVRFLYRYSRINEHNEQYVRQLLVEGKLYFSRPAEFNDPFECRPHFQYPQSGADARKLRRYIEKEGRKEGFGRVKCKETASRMMAATRDDKNPLMVAALSAYSNVRICCFTTHNDKLLMWSHYADSHAGLCVEFDATKMPFMTAYRVSYDEDYPSITYPLDENARALHPMLSKSPAWGYEDEYRLIHKQGVATLVPFQGPCAILQPGSITRIWLGAKMKPEFRTKVLSMAEDGPFSPEVYDVKLGRRSYTLNLTVRCPEQTR